MLVLGMDSKRQRRPNVRLGEIGDGSAAFACGTSRRPNGIVGLKRWRDAPSRNTGCNFISGYSPQRSSDFGASDYGVSPQTSIDTQQNRENKDPNSWRLGFEVASSDEVNMRKSKLNFGTITRKCRLMNRRARNTKFNRSTFRSSWTSNQSPELSNKDRKELGAKNFVGIASNACFAPYTADDFKDSLSHDTSGTSRELCEVEMDGLTSGSWSHGDFNKSWKKDHCYKSRIAFSKSRGYIVYNVSRWLEELGFGKYVGLFEMHGVDEETLPLLTFEDLKEIGVLAVGSQRRLYAAIQKVKNEGVEFSTRQICQCNFDESLEEDT